MIKTKQLIAPGVFTLMAVVGLATGNVFGGSGVSAATTTTTGTSSTSTAVSAATESTEAKQDPSQGGHIGTNGTKEALLTGDTADKVKAAALAEVPGGSVQRVENDAEGATYEAHMTKSDGSEVTVKLDSSFKVTGTETGHGGGGHDKQD